VASAKFGDGWDICGARTYAILDGTSATPTWVTPVSESPTANTFIIRVAIDLESYVAASPHTMTLAVGFANYPVSADALHPTKTYSFTITVVAATCDCTLIVWNEPENIPRIMYAAVVTTPYSHDLDEAGPL
jgi:hypothetical protein